MAPTSELSHFEWKGALQLNLPSKVGPFHGAASARPSPGVRQASPELLVKHNGVRFEDESVVHREGCSRKLLFEGEPRRQISKPSSPSLQLKRNFLPECQVPDVSETAALYVLTAVRPRR